MKNIVAAVLSGLLLTMPAPVWAGCRIVSKAVVVTQAAVLVATPVAVTVPVYGVAPGPNYAGAEDVAKLRSEIAELKALLAGGKVMPAADTPAPTKAAVVADTLDTLFVARCASCHDKASAAARGGGFALTDGDKLVAELDGLSVGLIAAHVCTDTMPKGPTKLTATEKASVMRWVKALKVTK